MDSPFLHLCAEESTDDKLFKLTSLYPLVSNTASISSAELPEDSSVEMFHFLSRGTNRLITVLARFICQCIRQIISFGWSPRSWLIYNWFSSFYGGFICWFIPFALSSKSFTSPFLSITTPFFASSHFQQQKNYFQCVWWFLVFHNLQMYPTVQLFAFGVM